MAKGKKNGEPVSELTVGCIEHVRFENLGVSPLNVRKDAEVGPDSELVHSIRSHGLLQPLVGYFADQTKRKSQHDPCVLICAGQRRLLALGHIAAKDTLVPVRIVDEETAIEVSLAENLERKDMNPADEVLAFKALVDLGTYNAERISSRFGFTLQHVRRRLKMANLLPEILNALRDGSISLDAATAYASASPEVQADIFKKHSAKGAWRPHDPASVRQDISLHGISASSSVARFIGGIEAYRAAGGTTIDEDFRDMFTDGQDDGRLRDVSIVRQLVERRQAELANDAEWMAKEKYPFATGIEWMDLLSQYGPALPKLPKKSELVLAAWNYAVKAEQVEECARAAAEKHGGQVFALIGIDHEGKLTVERGRFLVSKAAWAAVAPKEQQSSYRPETPEERAARERAHAIEQTARNLYGRSLVGDTPGFEVSDCRVNWHGTMTITLRADATSHPDVEEVEQEYRGTEYQLKEGALERFLEQATALVDAKIKAESASAVEFAAKLAELEQLQVAEWPAVVVINYAEDDDGSDRLVITRAPMGTSPMVLQLFDSAQAERWTSDDVGLTIEAIRDQTENLNPSIVIWDSWDRYQESLGAAEPAIAAADEPALEAAE